MYLVMIGGTPIEQAESCETAEEAEEIAIAMARDVAEADGLDPDTVDVYGYEGAHEGWGACPRDHDGAYYPIIHTDPRRRPCASW